MASPPDFLTIEEAMAVLAMGRTMAYREAGIYIATGGAEGAMPAIQLKPKVLRVPRVALEELLGGPLTWPPPRLDEPDAIIRIEPEHVRPAKKRKPRVRKPATGDQTKLPFTA